MNRYLLAAAALLALALSPLDRAHAGMSFCNQTPAAITSAIGYNEGGSWVSRGWYIISPGNCAVILSGPLTGRYYYAFATALGDQWRWTGSGASFCVTAKAFYYSRPPCGGDNHAENFIKIDTGDHVDYTFNFGCGNCRMPAVAYDAASGTIAAYAVISTPIGNSTLNIPVEGHFALGRSASAIEVSMTLFADLQPLQEAIPDIISKAANRNEECGDRVNAYSISLSPVASSAELAASARYQKWYCTYADVPQTTCHDTWIKIGPLKTKGVPSCSVTWANTRTSKNLVLQQSGNMRVDLTPQVTGGNQIGLAASVADAHLDGLGQVLADLFRVNLRALAQQRLDAAVGGSQMQYSIPNELRPFAHVDSVAFYDGGDRLMMRAVGRFSIALSQIAVLCNQLSGWSGCAAQ